MKKVLSLSVVVLGLIVFLSGCAGMDPRYQNNMAQNAGVWGTIGAVAGAGIAAVTGGDPLTAAVIGGVSGAALGAANTPTANMPVAGHPYYQGVDCSIYVANQRAFEACKQGELERARAWQQNLERAAYEHGLGVQQTVYPRYYYPYPVRTVVPVYDLRIIKVRDRWQRQRGHRR